MREIFCKKGREPSDKGRREGDEKKETKKELICVCTNTNSSQEMESLCNENMY